MENKLNPNWVTGFTDAEGCFHISLIKNIKYTTGWKVQCSFQIGLHYKDINLLEQIKSFFKDKGHINKVNNMIFYKVYGIDILLEIIVPHFDKYPLVSKKSLDFLIWKDILNLMKNKEHLKKETIVKIINLKTLLSKDSIGSLEISSYNNIINKYNSKPINHNWLAGFFSGDGCFYIKISKNKQYNSVQLKIILAQHSRDNLLLEKIKTQLLSGKLEHFNNHNMVWVVYRFKDIYTKIIPLFKKYKIRGIKSLDFQDFCRVADLMYNKSHLTLEGLKEINIIKSKMNICRNTYKRV